MKHKVTIKRQLEDVEECLKWLKYEGMEQGEDFSEDIKYHTATFYFKDPQKAFKFFCRWASA